MSKYLVIAAAMVVFAVACNKKEETAPTTEPTVEQTAPATETAPTEEAAPAAEAAPTEAAPEAAPADAPAAQ